MDGRVRARNRLEILHGKSDAVPPVHRGCSASLSSLALCSAATVWPWHGAPWGRGWGLG